MYVRWRTETGSTFAYAACVPERWPTLFVGYVITGLLHREVYVMLHYAVVFLVIAIIAAVLGFGGIAGASAGIAKILFLVFIVLFVVSLLMGRRRIL